MKILISGEAPLGISGYAGQNHYAAETFKALGHQVDFYAWANLIGGSIRAADSTYYPRIGNQGRNAHFVAEHAGADVVFTLQDLWPLPEEFGEQLAAKKLPWIAYFPIDGEPLMDAIHFHASMATWPVVYSQFGKRVAEEAGLEVDYIPHAINTELFSPKDNVADIRRANGFPEDAFIVTMVGTNLGYPSRKSIPEAFDAFASFQKRHPDAFLYYHGNVHPGNHSGYPILLLAKRLGIPQDRFTHVHQVRYGMGIPPEAIASIYAASDVLLMPSMGEGFGLPIAEAQACGTPVITQDCSSMSELTVNGIAIPRGQRFWRTPCDLHYTPRIADIEYALEEIYDWTEDERAEGAATGRKFILENYSRDVVRETYWRPFMERVEAEINKRRNRVWAKTGVYHGGDLYVPALDGSMDARRIGKNGEKLVREFFSYDFGEFTLDIEDDPENGVAPIVAHEIRHSYRLPELNLPKDATIVDIGAHVGVVSIYLAKRYPDARIIAVEPHPENYERLLRNIEANSVDNITAVNKAVTGDARNVLIAGGEGNSGGYRTHPSDGIPTKSITLYDLFVNHDIETCDLLKIDCEGSEYEILRGSIPLERVRVLRGEFHGNGAGPQALISHCKQYVPDVLVSIQGGSPPDRDNGQSKHRARMVLS